MSRKTLTTPFLDNLKTPPRGKRAEHRDTTPGLTLRVNDRGVKTWTLTYRVSGQGGTGQDGRSLQGKTRRLNIGRYPEMTLRDARTKADELWTLAAGGRDPAAQRHQRVMDRRETEQLTFRVVTDRWIEEAERGRRVGPKGAIGPGYLGDRRSDLEKMVMKHLGHRPVVDITKSDVRDALDAIDREEETGRHPFRVDNALKAIHCVFNYAKLRAYRDDNPAEGLPKRNVSEARDRVLSADERNALWAVTGEHGYPFGTAMRVLLLTAQRRNEVGKMRWKDLDLDGRVWKLPMKTTKSRRANEIPLSGPVLELLRALPRRGDFVFSTQRGETPISGWSKYKARIHRAMLKHLGKTELDDWRLHDLRRTAATGLAQLKVLPSVISLVLNHGTGDTMGVTAIYNQYAYMDEKRDALERWAAAVVPPTTPDDKIVKLRRPA